MFQNHIRIRSHRFDTVVVVVFEVGYRGVGLIRTQTVTEVQTESVHFVLRQPVFQRTGEHLLRRCKTMVPVLVHIIAVRCVDIEPGVVSQIRTVRIELVHRVQACRMVEHHIQDHRYSAFVALVDELLVHRLRTVGLIRREIVIRRIPPVVVTIELADRHQLDRVHTQVLDVIQTFHQAFQRTTFGIVVDPQLINDQVVLVRALEVQRCIRPLESRFTGLNHRHIAVCAGGITQQIRIYALRFILIVRMQHFLRIQIRDLFLHAIRTLNCVLETVLLSGSQARQRDPEIVTVLVQLIVRTKFPIGHITNQEHTFGRLRFAGSIGTQRHGCAIRTIVNTVTDSCRTCFLRRCHTCYIIPVGCVCAQSEHTQTNQTYKQLAHINLILFYYN